VRSNIDAIGPGPADHQLVADGERLSGIEPQTGAAPQ
jgi:hypothetical protein